MAERFDITGIDITILVAYLVISRIFPLLLTGKNENSEDYFLGSRNFIWPLIGLSLFATNMSGSSFVGLAGAGYNSGISVYSYEFMVAIILVIFIFFVLPFYLRSEIFTIPEFLERRYDRRTRLAFSGFNLFTNMFIDMAVALYAGALVFQTLFPAVPLWISVIVLALLAGVYTIFGGLGAVVISDSLQAVVLIIGGALVFIMTARAIPSWQAAREAAPEGAMHIIQPIGDDVLPWPGLITGVLIIGIYYWTTNQLVVQRTLGARSIDHGRWGSLFCGFLKLPVLFIMVLPGTLAVVLYPDLQSPDLVFPTLAFDLLPIGVRGIILAALVAAITSSVDSVLNSVSTLVTMDFVKSLRPDTSERTLVQVGRVATLGAMIVAIVWAPQITNFPTLWQYLQSVLAYVTPPIVAVFLLGIFWGRVNQYGAITTLAVGIPLGVVGFVLNEILGVFAIQFLYAAGISFATSLVLLTVVSLLSAPPPREQVEELTWRPALWREETEEVRGTPLWKNYRFLSIVLLISTVTIVYIFR